MMINYFLKDQHLDLNLSAHKTLYLFYLRNSVGLRPSILSP